MAQKLTLLGRLLPQTSWSLFSATRRLIWQFQWIQLSVTTRLIWQFCWVNSFILPEILMKLVCKDHLQVKYNAPHQISIWSIKSLISKEIKAKQCGQNELPTKWNTENNFQYFLKRGNDNHWASGVTTSTYLLSPSAGGTSSTDVSARLTSA